MTKLASTTLRPIVAILAMSGAVVGGRAAFAWQGSGPVYGIGEQEKVSTELPSELEGIDIVEHLGDTLPLELPLMHDSGEPTTLKKVLESGRPVLLQMGYMKCPMLCSLVLNELVRGLDDVDWTAGKEFDVVSISINPEEGSELAHAKKLGYLAQYERAGSEGGWHFLTGEADHTKAIADAVGFQFKKLPDGEYSHPAMVAVIAPDGRIVRYLYGVKYEPATLRMALLEGSEGTIGTPLDRFILWCHQYSPTDGGYVLFAFRLMQLGGALTLAILGTGVAFLIVRERRARRLMPPATNDKNSDSTNDSHAAGQPRHA